jgi:RND family efflux transporter MFP subunit
MSPTMQVFKLSAPPRRARSSTLVLLLCGAALLLATGCKPKGAPVPPSGPMAVQTLTLQPETVRDTLALDGTVQPSQQAQLTARVPGVLQAIHFQDGMPVRKGQLLFSIERTSYEEQVNLNKARLLQAESEFERQRKLVLDNATSQASVDTAQSNLQQAQANLRLAQLNLEYTEVRAPFDGVMGRRAVDVGNLVGATGPSVLGTLMQLSPAYVTATVNEREALRLRSTYAAHRAGHPKKILGVRATATLQGQAEAADTGVVDFIDHVVNASTGSVPVRARFDNRERRLLPGFYARLVIDLGRDRQALVLKKSWLLNDQEGSYVLTLGAGQKAQRVNLKVSPLGSSERVEVLEGLQGGEALIVEGHTRVKPGQEVKVQAARAGNAP